MSFFDGMMGTLFGGSDSQSVNNSGGLNVSQGMNVSNGINANYGLNESGSFGTSMSEGQSTSEGGSFSSGGSSGSSSSTQDIWGEQSPFLQEVYKAASAGNAEAQAAIQRLQPGIQNQMSNIAAGGQQGYNQMLAGGNAANLGQSQVAGMQGNSLQQQMLNGYNGNNPYMSGMKDMIAEDAQRLKQQNLGSLDARAAAAGMSGSSGYRNQVNDMMEDVDKGAMNAMTNLGYQANNQAIQDRMRLSGAADQYNMMAAGAGDQYAMQRAGMMDQNMGNAMANTGAMQQSAMNQFNPAMASLNAAGQFGQIIGGPTTLTQSQSENSSYQSGGSSNSSQSTNSSLSNNSSFSNGMNMGLGMNQGLGINGAYGANTGSGASSGNTQGGLIPGIAQGISAGKLL